MKTKPSVWPARTEFYAYIQRAKDQFRADPPDTDFQKGYLTALQVIEEDLFMTAEERGQARFRRAE